MANLAKVGIVGGWGLNPQFTSTDAHFLSENRP